MSGQQTKMINNSPKFNVNICIMAHVDHGKTTLADILVASNGIINQRQAGKIRYMDSRKDEIERGITMKSSCVSLTFPNNGNVYIINLVDSPGHVDFSSEVSTAVRLCDGTIIVVDVLEGVCAQTKVVMKQAWLEHIRPVLVLNKIDRLVLERKMAPLDAYYHISNVLEQVNAYMGELYNMDVFGRIAQDLEKKESEKKSPEKGKESRSKLFSDWARDDVDDADADIYFSPERGNVIFCSASDGWGFRIKDFADQFSSKIGVESSVLTASLWGDFYISSKGGKRNIMSGAREKGKDPLFVSLILDNIFNLYESIVPFRETIVETPITDRMNEAIDELNVIENKNENSSGVYEVENNIGTLKIRALPLPSSVTKLLENNSNLLQTISGNFSKCNTENELDTSLVSSSESELNANDVISEETLLSINAFKEQLSDAFLEAGEGWENAINEIWAFGPHFEGPNLLLNRIPHYKRPSIFQRSEKFNDIESPLVHYDTNLNMGFQMAMSSGPLCEEPVFGVCFCIEDCSLNVDSEFNVNISGQVISFAKDSFRKALESSHLRLMCAMYSCEISVDAEVVGKVYNVLGKRHGRITHGDITEGSTSWNVTAYLPVIESFQFSNDLRKATSGEAMPQLVFSHWETLDIDPSWVPQTTEELAHWGEKADSENLAKKYINATRKRKGLFVEEKIVEFAEKQRNLSKNK